MGYVKAKPELGRNPASLRFPAVVICFQVVPGDPIVGYGHPGFGLLPGFRGCDFKIQKFRGGILFLEVLHGDAPGRGFDHITIGFFQNFLFKPGGDIHGNGFQLVYFKEFTPVRIGGHALPTPPPQGSVPRTVNNRDTIGFPMLVHALESLSRLHLRYLLLVDSCYRS